MTDNNQRWNKITGMKVGDTLPEATFQTRVRDESIDGPNPYRWEETTMADYTAGRRVVIFSLPGAFTPTCSTMQLPTFEEKFDQFVDLGIDDIYCMSVNDSFVMNAWARDQELKRVKVIPDGSGNFTRAMGMLVDKDNLGFGYRSWRYAMVVTDGVIEALFREASIRDNADDDPYEMTTPENLLGYLRNAIPQEEEVA
ncbi:peroxyredoxin antioxidant [Phage C48C1]|nr:peroxyredoxin antioxidant [Phage C48C1]